MAEKLILISVPEYEQLLLKSCRPLDIPSVNPQKDIKQNLTSATIPASLGSNWAQEHHTPQQSTITPLVNESGCSPPPRESESTEKDKKKTTVIKKKSNQKSVSSKKSTFRIPNGWVSW